MTGRERVLRALRREEPDCVPTFEWVLDRAVCRALCGSEDPLDATEALDLDAAVVRCDYQKRRIDDETYVDEWGSRKRITAESLDVITESPLKDIREYRDFRFPDPAAPQRFATLERAFRRFGERRALVLSVRDVFSDIRDLVGYENALMALIAEPDAYRGLLDRVVAYNRALAKTARERYGVGVLVTTDDITDTRGLIMGPDLYFSVLAPHFREAIRGFKELGYRCIKHCDGNVEEVLGEWVEAGVDCIDPVDPNGGMDLARVKADYGERVCIKGNVNCETTLVSGTSEDVEREVRSCLRAAGPGGGYILSSSNSIHSGVRPDNYRAMIAALRRYGTYPLQA